MEANNKTGIEWIQQHTISILIGFVVLLFLITGFQYYQISGLQATNDEYGDQLSYLKNTLKLWISNTDDQFDDLSDLSAARYNATISSDNDLKRRIAELKTSFIGHTDFYNEEHHKHNIYGDPNQFKNPN
tara:strand:+ start:1623 stop:2012 length:390 start_codon:yes stop_codon:yes gene_type:complete